MSSVHNMVDISDIVFVTLASNANFVVILRDGPPNQVGQQIGFV